MERGHVEHGEEIGTGAVRDGKKHRNIRTLRINEAPAGEHLRAAHGNSRLVGLRHSPRHDAQLDRAVADRGIDPESTSHCRPLDSKARIGVRCSDGRA